MGDSERMQLVTAADHNYLHYLACLLYSLSDRGAPARPMRITVFHRGISPEQQQELRALVGERHELCWIEPGPDLLSQAGAPVDFSTSSPHYFRLLAPFFLSGQTRAIYLDADTIVLDDISPLWSLDLEGYPVAATPDYLEKISDAIENWRELRLNPMSPYFNSGVLVMDLARWRTAQISERVFNICRTHQDKLMAQGKWPQYDQYGLNVVFENRWKPLDRIWNRGTDLPPGPARIVHFIGNGKVGLKTCQPFYHDLFFDVLSRTPYGDWRPQK